MVHVNQHSGRSVPIPSSPISSSVPLLRPSFMHRGRISEKLIRKVRSVRQSYKTVFCLNLASFAYKYYLLSHNFSRQSAEELIFAKDFLMEQSFNAKKTGVESHEWGFLSQKNFL